MNFNFHGEPFDKLMVSFVSFYAGIAALRCIFKNIKDAPKSVQKYMIDMNFNADHPRNALEALGTCLFAKKANNTIVDEYTGAKLWKAGGSFVKERTNKISKLKSGRAGQYWENTVVMQSRFQAHSQYFQEIRKAMLVWDKLDTDEKAEAINAVYNLIMQAGFDNEVASDLVTINNELMATANVDGTYSLGNYAKKFLRKLNVLPLKEDDAIAPDAESMLQSQGTTSGDDNCQSTGNIALKQSKLIGGKLIKRRIKKFKSIKYKDPRKLNSNEEHTND